MHTCTTHVLDLLKSSQYYVHMYKQSFSYIVDALNKLSKCQKLLSGVSDSLSASNLDHLEPILPYITSMLEPILPYITNMLENTHHAILSELSGNSVGKKLASFEPSYAVGPGQKLQRQLQPFYRTTQKCGRKRQNILK